MDVVKIFTGSIIHCNAELFDLKVYESGYIIVKGKQILAIGSNNGQPSLEDTLKILNLNDEENVEKIVLRKSQLLIPGFIDTHIHAPQYPNAGLGYDKTLLDWLQCYTYKLEKRYLDKEFSRKVYDAVVTRTLCHGTTTACYFASMFTDSSLVLAESVAKYCQRAFVGKINMTKLAPDDYIESDDQCVTDTVQFIKLVKEMHNDLVQPIITPRFCLSVDMDLMQKLSELAKEFDLNIQTHISENEEELKMVAETYGLPYAKVYEDAFLLTSKTILAHGIYLTDDELKIIATHGASIAHCPQSNTCLKSGLCDVERLLKFGIKVGLGTDVSGGPSPSILNAMKAALDVSVHLSFFKDNYVPLNYRKVFYLATLGGAEGQYTNNNQSEDTLALDDKVGNFEPGKEFDALIVDLDIDNANVDYLDEYDPLELLQKLIYTGDDRNIVKVYVAGNSVK